MSKLNDKYLNFKYNNVVPSAGSLLISDPLLEDNFFRRSVILITEHGDDGSIGFMINKPVDIMIKDVIEDLQNINERIFFGGPVNTNTVHFLHSYGEIVPNSVKVCEGVYWGGDFDSVKELIRLNGYNSSRIRFFIGYSGWSIGQLDEELKQNSWIVTDFDPDLVLKHAIKDMWYDTLNRLGEKYKIWANAPISPGLN